MKLKTNKVKQTLKSGGVCFGTMLRALRSPHAIPLCASAGWDYVILDTEHQDYNSETLAGMCLAAKYEELVLLVRVPDTIYHELARPLDLGVEGLVCPRVESAEQAGRIIQSAKYHPLGSRGASVSATCTLYRECSPADYLEWANRETMVVVQIESQQALENIDAIVSTEGVDATMIGPFDLSQSMGIPGQTTHPRMIDAYRKVIEACNRHGVAPGIHLQTVDAVSQWVSEGMRFVTFRYDAQLLIDVSRQALSQLRGLPVAAKN